MKKIEIINNRFEIPYIDEDGTNYDEERKKVNKILSLVDNYSCYIEYLCDDNVFSDFKIVNYLKKGKFKKVIEVEKFIKFNEDMFEQRFTKFYFMNKEYDWDNFIADCDKWCINMHITSKMSFTLDDCGFISITYNPKYDKQIRKIIGEENIKKTLFEILKEKINNRNKNKD